MRAGAFVADGWDIGGSGAALDTAAGGNEHEAENVAHYADVHDRCGGGDGASNRDSACQSSSSSSHDSADRGAYATTTNTHTLPSLWALMPSALRACGWCALNEGTHPCARPLLLRTVLYDCVLDVSCNGQPAGTVPCHRVVLARAMHYFRCLFERDQPDRTHSRRGNGTGGAAHCDSAPDHFVWRMDVPFGFDVLVSLIDREYMPARYTPVPGRLGETLAAALFLGLSDADVHELVCRGFCDAVQSVRRAPTARHNAPPAPPRLRRPPLTLAASLGAVVHDVVASDVSRALKQAVVRRCAGYMSPRSRRRVVAATLGTHSDAPCPDAERGTAQEAAHCSATALGCGAAASGADVADVADDDDDDDDASGGDGTFFLPRAVCAKHKIVMGADLAAGGWPCARSVLMQGGRSDWYRGECDMEYDGLAFTAQARYAWGRLRLRLLCSPAGERLQQTGTSRTGRRSECAGMVPWARELRSAYVTCTVFDPARGATAARVDDDAGLWPMDSNGIAAPSAAAHRAPQPPCQSAHVGGEERAVAHAGVRDGSTSAREQETLQLARVSVCLPPEPQWDWECKCFRRHVCSFYTPLDKSSVCTLAYQFYICF